MKVIKYMIVSFCFQIFLCLGGEVKKADFVIFSYDRPIQLFALLESAKLYIEGLGQTTIIYRVSNDRFEKAYREVAEAFPDFIFLKQGANPAQDFKPLTLHAVFDAPNDYIMFAVDDIIVKDCIHLAQSIEQLERYGAYALYLRLGLHLNYCHPVARSQLVPVHEWVEDDVYTWRFCDGEYDWGYPHTVDMTLYRKKDIEFDLKNMSYRSPNTFEGQWASRAGSVMGRRGLFYGLSKIVNVPLNRVQNDCGNRHMNYLNAQELLDLFNQGLKIDIAPFYKIINNGAHTEYVPLFIDRYVNEYECCGAVH